MSNELEMFLEMVRETKSEMLDDHERRIARLEENTPRLVPTFAFKTWSTKDGKIRARVIGDIFDKLEKGSTWDNPEPQCAHCDKRIRVGEKNIWYCYETQKSLHESCIPKNK